jgi:ribosomal protein S12 methylthiotransferase accessory factor
VSAVDAGDLVDRLTGIADGCRTLPVDPGGPSIFQVTVRMADTTAFLGHSGDRYNSGAGLSEEAAWAAGIGEAVERYCVSAVRPHRMTLGSWASLPEDADALRPAEVALLAPDQPVYPRERFGEETVLAWLAGQSLVDGRSRLVPACLVYIPYGGISEDESLISPAISTGCASAQTFEDAVVSGLYECVERDAVSIVWLNRIQLPRLDIDVDWLARLVADRFERPNLEYHLFVAEFDLWAPTVACIIRDVNFDPPLLCIGGACRADAAQGALKAMIEAVQGWNWARYHRLAKGYVAAPSDYEEIQSFESRVELYATTDMAEAMDFLLSSRTTVPLSALPSAPTSRPEIIRRLVESIDAAGSDTIVIDLTTPEVRDMGFVVTKVFAPRLQQLEGDHRYRLLGGSRWRDVPVKLGLRAKALEWAELNPHPHPYP